MFLLELFDVAGVTCAADARLVGYDSLVPSQTSSTGWLLARALMAIGLMAGFYLFALAAAAGLFWIPYAEWIYVGRLHFKLAAVCIGGGCAVLWAVMPAPIGSSPRGPN